MLQNKIVDFNSGGTVQRLHSAAGIDREQKVGVKAQFNKNREMHILQIPIISICGDGLMQIMHT